LQELAAARSAAKLSLASELALELESEAADSVGKVGVSPDGLTDTAPVRVALGGERGLRRGFVGRAQQLDDREIRHQQASLHVGAGSKRLLLAVDLGVA
jgi:hypothetical protein